MKGLELITALFESNESLLVDHIDEGLPTDFYTVGGMSDFEKTRYGLKVKNDFEFENENVDEIRRGTILFMDKGSSTGTPLNGFRTLPNYHPKISIEFITPLFSVDAAGIFRPAGATGGPKLYQETLLAGNMYLFQPKHGAGIGRVHSEILSFKHTHPTVTRLFRDARELETNPKDIELSYKIGDPHKIESRDQVVAAWVHSIEKGVPLTGFDKGLVDVCGGAKRFLWTNKEFATGVVPE
jgi:hypothetical protein